MRLRSSFCLMTQPYEVSLTLYCSVVLEEELSLLHSEGPRRGRGRDRIRFSSSSYAVEEGYGFLI